MSTRKYKIKSKTKSKSRSVNKKYSNKGKTLKHRTQKGGFPKNLPKDKGKSGKYSLKGPLTKSMISAPAMNARIRHLGETNYTKLNTHLQKYSGIQNIKPAPELAEGFRAKTYTGATIVQHPKDASMLTTAGISDAAIKKIGVQNRMVVTGATGQRYFITGKAPAAPAAPINSSQLKTEQVAYESSA